MATLAVKAAEDSLVAEVAGAVSVAETEEVVVALAVAVADMAEDLVRMRMRQCPRLPARKP